LDEKSQETSVRAAGRANLATANGEAVSRNGARLKWQRGALLGSGSFGRVYLGLNLLTGGFMAVKQVELLEDQIAQHRAEVAALQNEISVLQTLKHANIVQYLGSSVEGSCLNIFLEYVPGGSISSLIKKFGSDEGLPETLVRYYTKQILSGLQYLHSNQIIHRDIKGANILVDDKGVIKLADFGASKKIEEIVAQVGVGDSIASLKGTVYWMAPEVIKQTGYGRQADIWSVGCTVIEMATGLPPWSAEYTDQVSALFTIATSNEMPSLPGDFSEEGKDFLAQCFRRNPKERPNATKLLQHPWLSTPSVPLNPKRLSSSQRSRPESLNLSTSMSRFSGSFSDDYSGSPRSEPSLTPNASSLMRDFSFKDSPESTAYGSLSSQPAT
jgi:serine/threonine protein kinase